MRADVWATKLKLSVARVRRAGMVETSVRPVGAERVTFAGRNSTRLPGVRTAAQFGKRSVQPIRGLNETWEQVFRRECLGPRAPEWIRGRAEWAMNRVTNYHQRHSTQPLPDAVQCRMCEGMTRCWKDLALQLFNGDPFAQRIMVYLPCVEPDFFREGAGKWNGKPTF